MFDTLNVNKDDRVTATEFIKLLKTGASRVFKIVIEDQVLRKLYDLFSAADSNVLSVSGTCFRRLCMPERQSGTPWVLIGVLCR